MPPAKRSTLNTNPVKGFYALFGSAAAGTSTAQVKSNKPIAAVQKTVTSRVSSSNGNNKDRTPTNLQRVLPQNPTRLASTHQSKPTPAAAVVTSLKGKEKELINDARTERAASVEDYWGGDSSETEAEMMAATQEWTSSVGSSQPISSSQVVPREEESTSRTIDLVAIADSNDDDVEMDELDAVGDKTVTMETVEEVMTMEVDDSPDAVLSSTDPKIDPTSSPIIFAEPSVDVDVDVEPTSSSLALSQLVPALHTVTPDVIAEPMEIDLSPSSAPALEPLLAPTLSTTTSIFPRPSTPDANSIILPIALAQSTTRGWSDSPLSLSPSPPAAFSRDLPLPPSASSTPKPLNRSQSVFAFIEPPFASPRLAAAQVASASPRRAVYDALSMPHLATPPRPLFNLPSDDSAKYTRQPSDSPLSSAARSPFVSPMKSVVVNSSPQARVRETSVSHRSRFTRGFTITLPARSTKRNRSKIVNHSEGSEVEAVEEDVVEERKWPSRRPLRSKGKLSSTPGNMFEGELDGLPVVRDVDTTSEDEADVGSVQGQKSENGKNAEEEAEEDVPEEEDEDENAGSSSAESEDEMVKMLLAKAAATRLARIASGIAAVPSVSTTPIATMSTSTRSVSPDVRRSSRAAVPKSFAAEEPTSMVRKRSVVDKGNVALSAMLKEKYARERKGPSYVSLSEARRIFDANAEADVLLDSDVSSEEDDDAELLSTDRIAALTKVVLGNKVAGDVERTDFSHLSAAAKLIKTKHAADLADLLKTELAGAARRKAEKEESESQVRARVIWKPIEETKFDESDVTPFTECGGWVGRVVAALSDSDALTWMALFSPLSDRGSATEHIEVSRILLAFICRPCPPLLADRAIDFLARVLRINSKSTNTTPLLVFDDFSQVLKSLGAVDSLFESSTSSNDDEETMSEPLPVDTSESGSTPMTMQLRSDCVIRMLRVVSDLCTFGALSSSDRLSLTLTVLRLALDPQGGSVRRVADSTLCALLEDDFVAVDVTFRRNLLDRILSQYSTSTRFIQLELLRAFPHSNKSCKTLRRWISWAFLTLDRKDIEKALKRKTSILSPPPLWRILDVLAEAQQTPSHPFHVSTTMDDKSLELSVAIYQITLADLLDDLCDANKRGPGSEHADDLVHEIYEKMKKIDNRIRTNVKTGNPARNAAKNALTRCSHTLLYQYRIVSGKGADVLDDTAMSKSSSVQGKLKFEKVPLIKEG